MPKPSHRETILEHGLRVVHTDGFANASVRDIVQAAGVPQGSFTNHFVSKEAFGLEIINLYHANGGELLRATLRNDTLPPLERLAAYIDAAKNRLNEDGMRYGSLFGNFTAEASVHSEPIRLRLMQIFAELTEAVAYCLRAAVSAGELPSGFDVPEAAAFVVSALQGAYLLAKANRSPEPVERFSRILFSSILR
jgi:TetR/AcrR family transcriptional regulator, transcriptional repressor for nem operon